MGVDDHAPHAANGPEPGNGAGREAAEDVAEHVVGEAHAVSSVTASIRALAYFATGHCTREIQHTRPVLMTSDFVPKHGEKNTVLATAYMRGLLVSLYLGQILIIN